MKARILTYEKPSRWLGAGTFDPEQMTFQLTSEGSLFVWEGSHVKVEDAGTGQVLAHCRALSRDGSTIKLEKDQP